MLRVNREQIERLPEEQREAARNLLQEYEQALRLNPLIGYVPHPKQREFHSSHKRMKAFLGGNRSGKTTAGILDDLIQAVDRDVLPDELQPYKRWEPPFYCRVVNPGFTMMEGVIFQKLREWCPKTQLLGGGFERGYDKQLRKLYFKNGSWLEFLTYAQDLDVFGGAALHRVHYDEEPPRDIRTECRYRLIDYGGDELFTMTPLHGMSWMFDEIYEPWTQGRLDKATVVLVDMDDNPHLDQEAKVEALAGLSREEREARKSGRFVHFAGLIYDEFRRGGPESHVIPQAEIPENARVFVGIDPGMRHMAAVVWAYLDYDDTLVVFHELGMKGSRISEVAEAIHRTNTMYGIKPEWYVIDPAARNIMHQTGRSDQSEFVDDGIVTILGQNAVTAGINRVKERLETRRLLIMANCPMLIGQFRKYRWSSPGRGEDEPKEKPVKTDDHLLDALRYLVMSRPQPPEARRSEEPVEPLQRAFYRDLHGPRTKEVPKTAYGGVFA